MNLSAIGWPQGALGSGYPDAPKNLLPGRIEGWPQGTQSSANEAERLLSTAVAWWDADHYEDGDKILRNRGIAGELLDLQLGSNPRVPTTNDPLYLAPEETGYVYLPGNSSDYIATNEIVSRSSVEKIDYQIRVNRKNWDWTTSGQLILDGRAYLRVGQPGAYNNYIYFRWYTDQGATFVVYASPPYLVDGDTYWLRSEFIPDNGSGSYEWNVYYAPDSITEPTSWVLSSTRTGTATTVGEPTQEVNVGRSFDGTIYRAIALYNNVRVLDIDCDAITDSSQTSFQAKTGQTVTIYRSTSGRKSVAMPSRYIKKWDDPHVYLPGVDGNYLSVPSEESFDITGDIDVRVKIATDVSSPSSDLSMISRNEGAGDRGIIFRVVSGGDLQWFYSTDGTDQVTVNSSTTPGFIAGQDVWVRVTHDVDNGAGGNDVKFYKSDDGVSWVQIGTTQTNAGTVSIYNLANEIQIGARGGGLGLAGKYYRAIIKDGIDGTTVLDVDMSKAPTNFTAGKPLTFLAETGQTVTLNSTEDSGTEVRPARFSRGKPLFLFGSDDFMQVMDEWQHQLLNFDAGDSFTVLAVYRVWANVVDGQSFVGKRDGTSSNGWQLSSGGTSSATTRIDVTSGGTRGLAGNQPIPFGELNIHCGVLDRDSDTGRTYINGVASATKDFSNISSLLSIDNLYIGFDDSGRFAPFEFTAAAIFRRALTPEEIATITNYYQTTAPGFQGESEITAIDLLESSVFWIDPNISEIV